jgi:hypothetical protein
MKKLWIQIRLLVAEKLLSLAMSTAPENTDEGKDLAIFVAEYCKKYTGNISEF